MKADDYSFSELELDALAELMNISFGAAAAGLAEVLDIFINLNIPYIKIIKKKELTDYIREEIPGCSDCSVIEQKFHGDFGGRAILLFPYGIEKKLLSLFNMLEDDTYESDSVAGLEKEVLMEVGNILIGACLGKIFELIDSRIIYFPPTVLLRPEPDQMLSSEGDSEEMCITLKTGFHFEDRNVEGHLFLINNKESIPRLKESLKPFTGIQDV